MEAVSNQSILFQIFDIEGLDALQKWKPAELCPYFVEPYDGEIQKENTRVMPKNSIFLRTPLITMTKYFPTYLIWVDAIEKLLQIFDQTILTCDQKIEVGIYKPHAKFLFVLNEHEKNLDKIFTYNEYLKKHQHVSLIQSLPFGVEQKFKFYGFNFYYEKIDASKTVLNNVWSKSNRFKSLEDVFTDLSQFKGTIKMFETKLSKMQF